MPSPTRSVATLSAERVPKAHGEAVNTAKRLARMRDSRLDGRARIQPGTLDAGQDAVVASNGGDQRGKTVACRRRRGRTVRDESAAPGRSNA